MSKSKWNDEEYINKTKESIGFSQSSRNITVMNKGNFIQRRFALSDLFLSMYNLSIEEKGFLFIKRSKYSPKLNPSKTQYVEFSQIQKLSLKEKIGRVELSILTMGNEKNVFKFSSEGGKYFPWQKDSVNELMKIVSKFNEETHG